MFTTGFDVLTTNTSPLDPVYKLVVMIRWIAGVTRKKTLPEKVGLIHMNFVTRKFVQMRPVCMGSWNWNYRLIKY